MHFILFLLLEELSVLSFKRESMRTMDYCDVSNWSAGDRSFSVHYKSLVIGFLRWSALVLELAELWEEPAWGPISPCLTGSGMSAPEGLRPIS